MFYFTVSQLFHFWKCCNCKLLEYILIQIICNVTFNYLIDILFVVAAVPNASHPLEVTVVAYESEKNYFKSGDEITFRITATHLGDPDGNRAADIRLSIASEGLEFEKKNGNQFNLAQSNKSDLYRAEMTNGSSAFVNMTYRVKSKLQPLTSLFISITGSFKFKPSKPEQVLSVKSSPILYSMPPQVNITSNIDGCKLQFL